VDYVNTADQAVLEAQGLLPPERVPLETAAGWTTRSSAFRDTVHPGVVRLYSSGHTKARRSGVRFRCSRRSTPSDFSDGHCLISVRRRMAHRRYAAPGRNPVSRPRRGAGLRRGQVMNPCCRSSEPTRRWVARKRARLRPPGPDEQVAARPAQGGCGSGVQRTELPRCAFSVSVPVMMLAEARLTASGRSLSPEHPEVSGQRKTLGNRNIQLSLPFG
jgi:hypothetical protein